MYTPFQTKVFRTIMKIPKGQIWTYGQVAQKMGDKKWAHAVGQALSKNLNAPTIPCHRVVGYNGIGGYSVRGGIKQKIRMLKSEKVFKF